MAGDLFELTSDIFRIRIPYLFLLDLRYRGV